MTRSDRQSEPRVPANDNGRAGGEPLDPRIGRIAEAAYLRPAPENRAPIREVGPWMMVPLWLLIAANFWFGIDTSLTLDTATRGAEVLMGVGP